MAPLWNRLAAFVYERERSLYNFQGLRAFKEKFHPVWEPRYLAWPGGIALPRVMADISALIAGGYRRMFLQGSRLKTAAAAVLILLAAPPSRRGRAARAGRELHVRRRGPGDGLPAFGSARRPSSSSSPATEAGTRAWSHGASGCATWARSSSASTSGRS